ncbi:MAG: FtsW/RodA/SpoVE family cell cycle protein, partial [Rothia sp. (in: high G+C Gram-positive bacteria)]|nr:FtsW/RodA/SpoVE family cell cycle protein [Rothia sp. (in: high G+C Gram-positive bacteria)]
RSTIIVALGALALAAFFFVITSPNRIERIINTLAFWRECAEATCDQANSGLAALATGGFWGVGLGQSRQKYNYLPEAHNDYIFAVIGEELGMLGGLTVLFLYAALIYCCMRILLRSSDLFVRFATIGMMTWLVGQAMLNIAMVVGMMPVIGVPLPFVSYGGSSLISSLIGVGFLIGFARQTPLQPIVGQSVVGANSTVQKDAARRYKLGRIVAAEQARIARNPYDAGWTLEKFKRRFGPESALLAPGAEPSSTRTGQRPSPSDAAVHSAATNKRSAAAQSQAPQRTAQQPGTRVSQRQQPTSAPVAGHRPSAQRSQPVVQETERQAEQRKLPTGLRTIRQARQLPKRPTNEP